MRPIPALTGLRFFAALCVVVSHSINFLLPFPNGAPVWHGALNEISAIGMPLFFVLSGFVIHYNYSHLIASAPSKGFYAFMVARFARLYPLYIICITFDLVVRWGYDKLPPTTTDALPYYLTLTQSWFYLNFEGTNIIRLFGLMPAVSWSVSTEWFFYLCYPVVCLLLVHIRSMRAIFLSMIAVSIGGLVLMAVLGLNYWRIIDLGVKLSGPHAAEFPDNIFLWFTFTSPYVEFLQFLLGCLSAALFMLLKSETKRGGLILTGSAIAAIVGLYALIYSLPGPASIRFVLVGLKHCFGFAPAIAVLIFCCARYENCVSKFLARPNIVVCGEASYSLYMVHLMISDAFRWTVSPVISSGVGIANALTWLLMLAATIGLSLVTWQLIEVPSRRWIRTTLLGLLNDASLRKSMQRREAAKLSAIGDRVH